MVKKYIGILVIQLNQGGEIRVSVYKNGRSITLADSKGGFLVHPQNEAEEGGWAKEYGIVRGVVVKNYEFLPPHLINSKN